MSYPEVAAFDLDYTVWPCFCDTHLNPPFKPVASKNGEVRTLIDSYGYEISFYKDVPRILQDLKSHDVKIVSASRTWAPEIAQDLLRAFKVEYNGEIVPLITLFDSLQWGEKSKVIHIRQGIQEIFGKKADIRDYKSCLFDDETRNRDVEKYGVKYVYVRDPEKGTTWELYQKYLNDN
ncbi:LAME_0C05336g1_1 [Lachancea meyersii CBS 8951]|uniref:LAME_0C05336g1_1 n=1 Tax=Lachancea meyersii CBS 8951 TaxID=1266667 RepID=A0A1G4J1H1_9SACH|nr:LAME_0C05336g1_1 [Lachancea meyersii CBS 8951]